MKTLLLAPRRYFRRLVRMPLWRIYFTIVVTLGCPYWAIRMLYSWVKGDIDLSNAQGWFDAFKVLIAIVFDAVGAALTVWVIGWNGDTGKSNRAED
jgi:hypothetical protein